MEEIEEEVDEGVEMDEEELENEILQYKYENEDEYNEEEEELEQARVFEYGNGLGEEEAIENEKDQRGNIGPEDGEAEDENDGFFGYAPF